MKKRSFTRRDFLKATGIIAGSGLISSCGEATETLSETIEPTSIARTSSIFAYDWEVVTFDPNKCAGTACQRAYDHFYNGLTRFTRGASVEPDLAVSWENPDPLVWTFNLRKGVKFHNGEELTADDVKFSIDRQIDPETAAPYGSNFAAIEQVEVVDPYTVKFILNQAYSPLPEALASGFGSMIMSKKWAEEQILDGKVEFASSEGGTGPYELVEFIPGDHFTLRRFEDYWDTGRPKIDDVVWKIILDVDSRVAALRAGTVDFAVLDALSADILKDDPKVKVYSIPGATMPVSIFNMRRAPFDDVRVRQAISLACDRQEAIDKTFGGKGSLAGPIQTGWSDWFIPVDELPYEVNHDKAKQLLSEAGFPDGFETTILGLDIKPYNDLAELMQAQMERIGIKSTVTQMEVGSWLDKIHEFDFDIHTNGYGFNFDPDGVLGRSFVCGSNANFPGYCDEEFDALRTQFVAISDHEERVQICKQMQWKILDAVPFIYWGTTLDHYGVSTRLKGFEPAFTQMLRDVFSDVYIE